MASGKPLTGKPVSLVGIPNTWVNTKHGVIKTPKRDLISNLDVVPLPDWRMFDNEHYEKSFIRTVMVGGVEVVVPIEGSRGCTVPCTSCSNTAPTEADRARARWRRAPPPLRGGGMGAAARCG